MVILKYALSHSYMGLWYRQGSDETNMQCSVVDLISTKTIYTVILSGNYRSQSGFFGAINVSIVFVSLQMSYSVKLQAVLESGPVTGKQNCADVK